MLESDDGAINAVFCTGMDRRSTRTRKLNAEVPAGMHPDKYLFRLMFLQLEGLDLNWWLASGFVGGAKENPRFRGDHGMPDDFKRR